MKCAIITKAIAISACILSVAACTELSAEDFAAEVEKEKAAMQKDKALIEEANKLCSNLSNEIAAKEPKCVALNKYKNEKLNKLLSGE
ncbi:hypothetical protein [Ectopseudomonas composti]|uniref:hypothetical protein n=1 Tax=Ectopseudomonas composti TaxID=658457 RepID=UPI0012E359D4|nr:hypothetical protein [Pseudomonas composti]